MQKSIIFYDYIITTHFKNFKKNSILKGGTLKRSKQDENLGSNLEDESMENEMDQSHNENENNNDGMTDDDITKGRYCYMYSVDNIS